MQGRPRPAFVLTLWTFLSATDVAHALPSAPRGPLPLPASGSPLGRAFREAIEEENEGALGALGVFKCLNGGD